MNINQNPHYVTQNSIIHSIASGQSPIYQSSRSMISNQNLNLRSSLLSNVTPSNYGVNPQQSQVSQGHVIRQPVQLIGYQKQPIHQQYQILQPVQSLPIHQSIRTPHHIPQNMISTQKVESQSLLQPVLYPQGPIQRL